VTATAPWALPPAPRRLRREVRPVARPSPAAGPDRIALRAVVVEAIVAVLEVARTELGPGAHLVEDLGADSLALVEIVEIVEGRLRRLARRGFAIADRDIESLVTVGAFVDYLEQRI
jgi:acyl carrier protein